jgi:hypothetical protein
MKEGQCRVNGSYRDVTADPPGGGKIFDKRIFVFENASTKPTVFAVSGASATTRSRATNVHRESAGSGMAIARSGLGRSGPPQPETIHEADIPI